ncbi:MAG: hypothetical protein IJX99_09145 [Clostridia bacterium]|nr:hypothetical protein [Clostridia bacterium]
MERYEGLRRITSHEGYLDAKKRLEGYLKQYKWITETDSPYEDIKNALVKCVEKRKAYEGGSIENTSDQDGEKGEETQVSKSEILENENAILSLKVQYEAIKSDTYAANLRRNITALYVSIGDYEARIESKSRKNKDEKESEKDPFYTSRSMRRFRFFLANLTGLVPGEVNMNVENNKAIPLYIIENYDLVNKPEITEEQKEMALVVVPEVDYSVNMVNRLFGKPVDQFIAAYGIKEKAKTDVSDKVTSESEVASKEEVSVDTKQHSEVPNQHTSHTHADKSDRNHNERNM